MKLKHNLQEIFSISNFKFWKMPQFLFIALIRGKWRSGGQPVQYRCWELRTLSLRGEIGRGTDRQWQTRAAWAAACKYFVSLPDRPAVFWKFIRPLAPFVTSKFNLLYFVCFLREANKKRKNWKKNKLKMNIIMNSFLSNLRGNLAIWNLPKTLARMLASTNKSSDSNRTS